MRVLVTGWPSFRHGEATAGDVLSMRAIQRALSDAGVDGELAWSPVFRPGALSLADADPARYTDLVFACGPAHGEHWLGRLDCATAAVDTRLDSADWRQCGTPDQLISLLARFDVVISTRLHGLVLGLRAGVPVLAVDPVSGGGKVSAQATALRWPAIIGADAVLAEDGAGTLTRWWHWCRSSLGRACARACARAARPAADAEVGKVVRLVRGERR